MRLKGISFATNTDISESQVCVLCKSDKHPLFSCSKFKELPHDGKLSVLKAHNLCKSVHRCRKCRGNHHTLFHKERPGSISPRQENSSQVATHTTISNKPQSLLMTCRILVHSPNGSCVVRALLDSASSASFISDQLSQSLYLPRAHHGSLVLVDCHTSHQSTQSPTFWICPVQSPHEKVNVTAVVVPKVTCDLPRYHIPFDSSWSHLSNLELADPEFGTPGPIDLLLGVDVFVEVLLHYQRVVPCNTPAAIETKFGWIIAGILMDKKGHFYQFYDVYIPIEYCQVYCALLFTL